MDFGRGEYLMLVNVVGIRSVYDTATHEDFDISKIQNGIAGNFAREAVPALHELRKEVEDKNGGMLRLTDMNRTWNMQWQANQDYLTGKKRAFSPPPGESFHNAGRSIDVDIRLLEETLQPTGTGRKGFDLFWEIYNDLGFSGVVQNRHAPDKNATEAWHIDYMGIFKALYARQRYKAAAIAASMDAMGNNFVGREPEYIKTMRIQAYLLYLGLLQQDVTGLWNNATETALNDYVEGSRSYPELNLVLEHYGLEKNISVPISPVRSGGSNFFLILSKILKGFLKIFSKKEGS
jgi:hypothetical protein